jgi:hypothetical protein
MELMLAAMALDPSAYRTDARLMEMSFGPLGGLHLRRAAGARGTGAGGARTR